MMAFERMQEEMRDERAWRKNLVEVVGSHIPAIVVSSAMSMQTAIGTQQP
jgi:hypothetical protein